MRPKTLLHKLTAWLLTLAMLTTFITGFTLGVSAAENFYIVAGSPELFGEAWNPAAEENMLSLAADGNYYKTYNNVAAGTYLFKVTTNGAWDNGEYNLEGDATFGGADAQVTVERDGSVVIIGFDGTKALVEVKAPVDYPLWVGGVQVTSANADDVFDDGTVSYNADTNTLTLNNYIYEGEGHGGKVIDYEDNDTLNLVLNGTNSIGYSGKVRSVCVGIYVNNSIVISGEGSLAVISGDANLDSYGIYAQNITISGGTVTAVGGKSGEASYGVYCISALTVSGGSLIAIADTAVFSYGVYVNSITVDGGSLIGTGGTVNTNGPSNGIFAGGPIDINAGVVRATAGTATQSVGLRSNGIITISGGTVEAIGVEAGSMGSYGLWASGITISGGETIVQGVTGALLSSPDIDSTFTNAAVWYGESADEADSAGAKPIANLENNYSHKYVKVAEGTVNVTHSVSFSAIDCGDGMALEGAHLQILDDNNNVVDEWITAMDDAETADVDESVYVVGNLKTGTEYTLHTDIAPYRYTVPEDLKFSIGEDGKVTSSGGLDNDAVIVIEFSLSMVGIRSIDAYGNDLAGALLQIIDMNGDVVVEWVSGEDIETSEDVDESVYEVTALEIGTVYTLHTDIAPYGYTVPEDLTFAIDEGGNVTFSGEIDNENIMMIRFKPTVVRIRTVDADGNTIAGATVQILDRQGGAVEEWVSEEDVETSEDIDESVYEVTVLGTGTEYTLHTTVAPDGYTVPEDLTFSFDENGNVTFSGEVTADGVLLVKYTGANPEITSLTFNSDSNAFDAQTNTFWYDAENSLELVINGKNLKGQRIYLALGDVYGIHVFFIVTADHSTTVRLSLKKQTLDSVLKSLREGDLALDIVKLWVHLYDIDDEMQYLFLNVKPLGYTVTFNPNGADTEPTTATTVDGKLQEMPTPTRSGYVFNGWFDAETGGNKITTDTLFTDDTTIYAQWIRISSGGGYSNTTATTTKNDDGSTTKTTTNKATGTTTETTTYPDGSSKTVETRKNGTVTTTEKDKDGNIATTVEKTDGTVVTTAKDTDGTKTVTTENADGSRVTEESKKDGTKITTKTTADGETKSEINLPKDKETEVTIPVPDAEAVKSITVTDKNGNETEIADFEITDDGVKFIVSDDCTAIIALDDARITPSKKEFEDVHHAGHWATADVDYVYINGLMNGTSETHFSPDVPLTRAMLVTVLYRLEGEPATNRSIPFADVDMGAYYADAVSWAKQIGIVNGVSETEFAPNDNITREQIAAIMHRFAQYKGIDVSIGENTNILSYKDFDDISEYAISAMQWVVGSGLIRGRTESTLNPLENATRAETAAILHSFTEINK